MWNSRIIDFLFQQWVYFFCVLSSFSGNKAYVTTPWKNSQKQRGVKDKGLLGCVELKKAKGKAATLAYKHKQ